MSPQSGLAALANGAILSPFTQLRRLLDGIAAGTRQAHRPDHRRAARGDAAVRRGEARRGDGGLRPAIRRSAARDELRAAIAAWAGRRYGAAAALDADARGFAAQRLARGAVSRRAARRGTQSRSAGRPAILMCNPYYSAYIGGALAADAEPVYLNATAGDGPPARSRRDRLRQGAARAHRRALPVLAGQPAGRGRQPGLHRPRARSSPAPTTSCCSSTSATRRSIPSEPPPGALQVAAATPERFRNLVVFNSLSKRSNLPGLRSGFCAGDARFIETFAEIRNMVAPQVPGPTQHVSAAVWADEAHVVANRAAYRAKFDVCDRVLGRPLRLPPPGRRLLPLARCSQVRRRQ